MFQLLGKNVQRKKIRRISYKKKFDLEVLWYKGKCKKGNIGVRKKSVYAIIVDGGDAKYFFNRKNVFL